MVYDDSVREISVSELWKLQSQRARIAKQYLDTWNQTANITKSGRPIDAIIRSLLNHQNQNQGIRLLIHLVLLLHIQLFYMIILNLELHTLQFGIY